MSRLFTRGLVLLWMTGGPLVCLGQGVVEYGAATASKTAGAGARGAGNALGKILKKTGNALDSAQHSAAKPAAGAVVVQRTAGAEQSAAAKTKTGSGVEPTPEALEKLAVGTPAEELEAKLGLPAFRVVVPEEGRLVEIYQYSAKGRDVGSVRVVDGKVAEVRPAAGQ
ncbi:MAG: hypothetical protein ACOYX1_12415 [Acidobacteriota bacterium]